MMIVHEIAKVCLTIKTEESIFPKILILVKIQNDNVQKSNSHEMRKYFVLLI